MPLERNAPRTARSSFGNGARLVPAAAIAGLLVLSFLAFWPVLGAGFLQDDYPILAKNPVIREGRLGRILLSDYWAGVRGGDPGLYRPLTLASFLLERGPGGEVEPRRAHVSNVLLNALAGAALLLLARRIGAGLPTSVAAAAFFVLHPAHISAVAPLVNRAEILAALFTLGALLAYSYAGAWEPADAPRPHWTRTAAAWTTGALVLMALGSKEVAVAALPLLVVLDLLFRPPGAEGWARWARGRSAALLPSGLALALYLAVRAHAVGSLFATQAVRLADNPLVALDGLERAGTAIGLVARAVRILVWPAGLSPDYSGNVIAKEPGLLAARPLAGLALLLLSLLLAASPWIARSLRDTRIAAEERLLRAVSLAALLFLLPWLVVGNLFVLVGIVFAERLLYLPSAGLCLLVPLVLSRLRPWLGPRPAAALATAGVLLAGAPLLLAARAASRDYSGNEAMWAAPVRDGIPSPRACFTLGKIRADQGKDDEALNLFERTTSLWPYFSSAWFEKGVILARRGEFARAEAAFRQAVSQNPGHDAAAVNLGIALHAQGKLEEAERALRDALARFPGLVQAEAELGDVLFDGGRFAEAAAIYAEAVRHGRTDLEARLREAEARAR